LKRVTSSVFSGSTPEFISISIQGDEFDKVMF
jgi:hypothetical protein